MKARIRLLAIVLLVVGVGVWFVLWRGVWSSPPDPLAEARAFARAFVEGDVKALWWYASKEEKDRLDLATVERLYDNLIVKELGGVHLYTGVVKNVPREYRLPDGVGDDVWVSREYGIYRIVLQSRDGAVVVARLRLRLRGRRLETSLSQFFMEVARGYVGAQIPWDDGKTNRTVVALEKFGDVFRSSGLSGLYDMYSRAWFTLEEWEAFARSGQMRGTGFD